RAAVQNVSVQLTAPSGWSVQANTASGAGAVPSGHSLTTSWTVTPPANSAAGSYDLTATARYLWDDGTRSDSTGGTTTVLVPNPPPHGTAYVSDLQWTSQSNGWGPVERDMSNGETAAGDGHAITIGGVTYAKGIGAHAPSEVDVYLGGNCSSFSSDVGLDDEVGNNGSVDFQVFADGTKVADSGVVHGSDSAKHLTADLAGAKFLRLVITDAGDGNTYDHSDWAGAAVSCG
ncbi:MAG TPA: NPCBM/NEW2 domain-containing protein, partial [Jatrophihabitans sp.]|nr:NPCBM/NEW2 domain-containing protein [Jatrophihabitans sp.]